MRRRAQDGLAGEVAEVEVPGLQGHGHHPVRLRRRSRIRIGTPQQSGQDAEGDFAGEDRAGDIIHQKHEGCAQSNADGQQAFVVRPDQHPPGVGG